MIKEVNRHPHWAEPAAEEIPEDQHEKEYPEGWEHSQNDMLLCEDGNDSDEWIESKVKIYRKLQFEGKSCL
jgi:hypothetical protein